MESCYGVSTRSQTSKCFQLETQIKDLRIHPRFHLRKRTSYPPIYTANKSQNRHVLPIRPQVLKFATLLALATVGPKKSI
jgi:hypothetical protein